MIVFAPFLLTLMHSNPLYSDLKKNKKTLDDISQEIITLKIERHGIQE